MGNCLKRNKETETPRSNSGHFMGFRVVSVKEDYGFSKLLFRCKKRLTRNSEYINIESNLSQTAKTANLFDYEEPLGVLDDQEVHAFLKSEDMEKAESVDEESLV